MLRINWLTVVLFASLTLFIEKQAEANGSYENLNRELISRIPSDDFESNIQEIERMLQTLSPRESSLTTDDFQLMSALLQLKHDNKCSKFTRDIFIGNSVKESTHEASLSSNKADSHSSSRVEKLLGHFCVIHAKDCHDTYETLLNSKLESMEKLMLNFVTFYTDVVLNEHYEQEEPGKTIDRLDNFELYEEIITPKELVINEIKDGRIAFDVIRTLEKIYGDKNFDPVTTPTIEHRISRDAYNIYQYYLVEPCEYYIEQLGESVFEPATIDAKYYQNIADRAQEFYLAWARYSLCRIVVEDSSMSFKVKNIAENLVRNGRN